MIYCIVCIINWATYSVCSLLDIMYKKLGTKLNASVLTVRDNYFAHSFQHKAENILSCCKSNIYKRVEVLVQYLSPIISFFLKILDSNGPEEKWRKNRSLLKELCDEKIPKVLPAKNICQYDVEWKQGNSIYL